MASALRIFKTSQKLAVPNHFRCPISLDLMRDPITLTTGITYDRQSIETWLDANGNRTCPITNQLLSNLDLTPNHTIRKLIQDWCVANKSLGIERIPTPRAPVTSTQVADVLADIELASWQKDGSQVLDLVSKIKKWTKESERNKKCISSNGSAKVLAMAFSRLTASQTAVGTEILSALTGMFPLDAETCRLFVSPDALKSLVSVLESGDLAARLNAVVVIKEVAADKERAVALAKTQGLIEAVVKLIKEPISPRTTKASLVASYYLVSSTQLAVSRFVELGMIPLLLEIAVDSEKSICEKALGVLDGLLGSQKGREMAYDNALTMPVLVKKMFRVSDMATEFAVSALWKLCKNCEEGKGRVLGEAALSVGAFQKLLLLLQVGCSEGTKEKASELLRMLNAWKGKQECIESADFKGLKRNF